MNKYGWGVGWPTQPFKSLAKKLHINLWIIFDRKKQSVFGDKSFLYYFD